MAEEYDEAFNYDWTQRGMKTKAQRSAQYATHTFPLSVIGMGGWELGNWVQGYEQFWKDKAASAQKDGDPELHKEASLHATNAHAFGEHLKGITEEYQIAYIELDRDIAIDKVCDIFTQINSKGVQLDTFDLFNALLKPKGLQLKQMYRQAAPRLEFVGTDKMNVYILQVMSILRQGYCSPKYLYYLLPGQEKTFRDPDGSKRKEVLIPDVGDFQSRWKQAVTALEEAIKLLKHPQEFGAISANFLPYVSILPAFSALQHHVKTLPANKQLAAQRKIRHWYWASVYTNRYSGAVESTSARDFLDVKAWMEDDSAEPPLLLEFRTRFKTLDLRKEVRRGTSVYNGIFNLLVIQGARDWMTGNVPQYDDLDDHHIVPASWGAKQGNGIPINSILNRTPLTADTNRKVIGDRLPNAYLPDLIKDNGDAAVRAVLESHFISPAAQAILLRNPFTSADFEAFIAERQRTFQEAIEHLLIKERLDLSPELRELDERIEKVELALRDAIDTGLGKDLHLLPQQIALKMDERLQRALAKNAALEADLYKQLSAKLEFCDFRELQDVIVNNALWPRFQPRFANKDRAEREIQSTGGTKEWNSTQSDSRPNHSQGR